MAAYRSRAWGEAEEHFRAVLALWKGDSPSSRDLDDIADKRLRPPGEDWDGVYETKTQQRCGGGPVPSRAERVEGEPSN